MPDLESVYDAYRSDPLFDHLRRPGVVLVPGDGSYRPKIMIVGEAPGATENTLKKPFVGASGRVLRSLITDVAQLDPSDYFITNVIKYNPLGNRTPTPYEINISKPYLRREYAALGSPPIMITVGAVAKTALASDLPSRTMQLAGKNFARPGGKSLWVMIHPAYALRNRAFRPSMERHWNAFGEWFRKEYPCS